MWNWIIGILALGITFYFLDREIYFYEGAHLGLRMQGWLYDHWAANYDECKQESQEHDAERLAHPIIVALAEVPEPSVLDYTTGTDLIPLALLREPKFKGHVVAVDVSKGILEQAKTKPADCKSRYELVHLNHLPLLHPDNSFDVVSCMEALELMPNMEEPLTELFRILKLGGTFMSSHARKSPGVSQRYVV